MSLLVIEWYRMVIKWYQRVLDGIEIFRVIFKYVETVLNHFYLNFDFLKH